MTNCTAVTLKPIQGGFFPKFHATLLDDSRLLTSMSWKFHSEWNLVKHKTQYNILFPQPMGVDSV